jgi:hypothetical protein
LASKLLLLSVVIAMIALPLWQARDKHASHGLKVLIFLMIAFNLLYFLAVRFVYPRLL